uniref:Histone domain-containing protein n=1 Tax=Strongyloides venezuelensis TaxID=75913 RepID=A0A0K0F2Z8_STRVS
MEAQKEYIKSFFKKLSDYTRSKTPKVGFALEEIINETKLKFRDNKMEMVTSSFMELFTERATAQFFVLQVFCVCL